MDMNVALDDGPWLARREVDEMLAEHEGSDLSFSYQDYIDGTERALEKGPACGLDPPSQEHWRAVVEELYRRQAQGWLEALEKTQAEAPWSVYSPDDFAAMLEYARRTLPVGAKWRESLEREAARQMALGGELVRSCRDDVGASAKG